LASIGSMWGTKIHVFVSTLGKTGDEQVTKMMHHIIYQKRKIQDQITKKTSYDFLQDYLQSDNMSIVSSRYDAI